VRPATRNIEVVSGDSYDHTVKFDSDISDLLWTATIGVVPAGVVALKPKPPIDPPIPPDPPVVETTPADPPTAIYAGFTVSLVSEKSIVLHLGTDETAALALGIHHWSLQATDGDALVWTVLAGKCSVVEP
jgi:hypothetical protein